MENEELISVVVPVYNVEKCLEDCLDSIINQSYKNTEIILIDDGSTDKSGNICDEYANKDNRIKVLHKENNGVSSARNDGMAMANGEYLTFVDSDDIIHPDYLAILYQDAIDYDADIVHCAATHKSFGDKPYTFPALGEPETEIHNGRRMVELALVDHKSTYGSVRKLYKKSILEDIEFVEGQSSHEDSLFVFKLALKRPVFCIDNRCLYMIIKHSDSLSKRSISEKKIYDMRYTTNYKIEETLKRYPEFIDFVRNLDVKCSLAILGNIVPYYKEYEKVKNECINIVLNNSKYYIPATKADKRLFFLVTHNLYDIYCFIKSLSKK